MPRGKVRDRDGIFTRKDRPGAFYGSWVDATGKRRKRKLEAATLQQARALVAAEKQRAEKIKTQGIVEPTRDTFASVMVTHLKDQKRKLTEKSYVRTSGIANKYLTPFFGSMTLGKIQRPQVLEYLRTRNEATPGTIAKELNVLKGFFTWAMTHDLIPYNPAAKVKGPQVPAGRLRYLQPTELRALLDSCPDWLRPIAGLAAFTGMRRGEILGIRWLDTDLNGARVILPQTKNGDGRVVYLNQLACDCIRSQWNPGVRSVDRIFPVTENFTADNVSKAFVAVCDRLGIDDFSFHDLRHTAASWMRMLGADIHTVATQLGHKDLRMAARYQHLSSDYMTAAVGRLDAAFGTVSEHEVEYRNEPSSRSIVPTASPQKNQPQQEEQLGRDKSFTMLGLIGSDIGARTRTLRLERATC